MPLPSFIAYPSSEGDEHKFPWSTRVSESVHQWLMDLRSEYNLPNKSETLRACVVFTMQYIARIAEENDETLGKRIAAATKANNIIIEQNRRKGAHRQILDLLSRAAEESSVPIRLKLEDAAKELAGAWSMPFPPPDMPLIARDRGAALVLRSAQGIARKNGSNRVRLNDINQKVFSMNARELRETLDLLASEDYLSLEENQTSGPPTLWVILPALEPSGVFNY